MATMLIRESSDLDEATEPDFELEQENQYDIQHHSHTIFLSKDILDRRLVNAYKIKRWRDDFKRNKGKVRSFKTIKEERARLTFQSRLNEKPFQVEENDAPERSKIEAFAHSEEMVPSEQIQKQELSAL